MSKSSSECPILEAPNEILYIISGFLDSGCILRLRQTCKRLSGTRISTVSIPETTLVKQVIRKLPRTEIQHLSVSETLLPCVVSLRTRVQSLDLTATNNEYYRSCGKLENLFFCRLTGFDMDSLDFLKNPIRKLHLYNCQGTFYKTIGLLRQLRVLELHFCRSLKELEHVDSDMEVLELVWCHQLKNITHINALSHLRQLVLCRLPIDALPDLTNTRLERLQLWRCSSLSNANQLSYLKHLRVLELHTVPLTELPDLDQLPLERLQLHQLNRLHDVSCLGGMHLDFLRISFCDFLSDLTVLETMTVKQLELVRLSRLSRMSWSIGTQVLVFDIEHSIEIPSRPSVPQATGHCEPSHCQVQSEANHAKKH
ncbi:hypothetical protein EDD86DRAFT_249445 [Gorgonomyces haynaldii]|nr:hypothetical protein EDD86DRAFT_249445 [Gorgonomyces haynaldii]